MSGLASSRGSVVMTRKQQIMRMVERLDEDVGYDRVIYHLSVMKGIEIGLEQAERGEGMEHDDFMRRLEAEWQESSSSGLPKRKTKSGKSKDTSRATPPKRRSRSRVG